MLSYGNENRIGNHTYLCPTKIGERKNWNSPVRLDSISLSFLDSRSWQPFLVCGSLLPSSRTAMSLTHCHLSDSLFLPPFSSSKDLYDMFSSVAQSCPTLCDPMNCSTPGLPVHHQLLEFTHTHVHRVGDAIQPSHPLSSPSPPAPNPSQHQSLFQ